MLEALQIEFGVEAPRKVALHGRTDFGILSELLEVNGVASEPDNLGKLCERYFSMLPTTLAERQGVVLPGVQEVLDAFDGEPQVTSAILTGNMARSAQIKLEHYNLWHYFAFGVYGDSAAHRTELAEPALQLVQSNSAGQAENREVETLIIGDTPMDVELAKAMQIRCLAVCTGGFSSSELADSGADLVLEDLSDLDVVRDWCLQAGEPA